MLPKALVVLGFDDGSRVMRPVSIEGLEPDASPQTGDLDRQLRRLQERLRSLCVDRTLERAMRELRALQRAQAARVDSALGEALRLGLVVCAGAALDPLWLQVAGQRTLAGGASLDTEALGDILGLLEDYQRLAEVLCQLLPSDTEDPFTRAQVRLGVPLGRPERASHGVRLTVVGCRLPLPQISPSTGLVALLGSDRMDYACAIPLVEYAARSLASHGES